MNPHELVSPRSPPRLTAIRCTWAEHLAADFESFTTLCLDPEDRFVESYPCPNCSCWHRVVPRHDRTGAIAVCRCDPPAMPRFPTLDRGNHPPPTQPPQARRHIARALGIDRKPSPPLLFNTAQIGAWSADAVPVLLTIQNDYAPFCNVIAQLGVRLKRPFILLSPTAKLLNTCSIELLAHTRSALFPLETTVTLTPAGTLVASKSPGILFAQFTPQPKELDEDIATRVFALVRLWR